MKHVWLFLLMIAFPLQAALAAVETYSGHGSEAKVNIESVLHTHADHDAHEHGPNPDPADANGHAPCEGDHHHCHGHGVTVLGTFTGFEFFSASLTLASQSDPGYQSLLSNRIERPNWV